MSGKPSLFSELKRRHVDKVVLVYAVVAWLLIESAWIFLPNFDAPSWILKAFIILLGLGFIFTVIISWNFEMTPEGMKRTADITQDELQKSVLADDKIKALLEGKTIKKVIVVPGKLVNIVVA